MSSRLTGPSARLYQEFLGTGGGNSQVRDLPNAVGPTLVKVEDPLVDLDRVVELLDEGTHHGRIANSWLRRRSNRRLSRTANGDAALEGRPCCMTLARQIDRELFRIELPKDYRCDSCGTLWRVEIRVREDRRTRTG